MHQRIVRSSLLIVLTSACVLPQVSSSATITWTNSAGGAWSDASSWDPNQVPGAGDSARITASGAYTVSLDAATEVSSLVVGGNAGVATLSVTTDLTLDQASSVGANGILELAGGNLRGPGSLAVAGKIDWSAGVIWPDASLGIAAGGSLTVNAVGGSTVDLAGAITNAGQINLLTGNLRCISWTQGYSGGLGLLVNQAGGAVMLQGGSGIQFYNDTAASPAFINHGSLTKLGTDPSAIDAPFLSDGSVTVSAGALTWTGGGQGTSIAVAANSAVGFSGGTFSLMSGGSLNGAGTATWSGGEFYANGVVKLAQSYLNGAMLSGTGVLSNLVTWTSGQIAGDAALTIAPSGTLDIDTAGAIQVDLCGAVTNEGVINLLAGSLRCIDFDAYGFGPGLLVNAAGGVFDASGTNVNIAEFNNGPVTPEIINRGMFRRTSGSTLLDVAAPFYNSGTVDVQTGVLNFHGGGDGSGVFHTDAGATVSFNVDYVLDASGTFTGAGTNEWDAGVFTLNGSVTSSNSVLAGATLTGSNIVTSGVWTWANGVLSGGSFLTIQTNSSLLVNLSSGVPADLAGTLTNAGVMRIQNGDLRCLAYVNEGGGPGQLYNLPGALVDLQDDSSLTVYDDFSGPASPAFINEGTLRKSGGTNTSSILVTLTNRGALDAQVGTIAVAGTFDLTGGTLRAGINSLTDYGVISFASAPTFDGTISATLNHGYQPIEGNSFPILTFPTAAGAFTNSALPGRMAWQTSYDVSDVTLTVLNVAPTLAAIGNHSVNETAALSVGVSSTDPDLPPQGRVYSLLAAPAGMGIDPVSGVITWTPLQTQSPSTNTVTVKVVDTGTPPLSDTNSFLVTVVEINNGPKLPVISTQTVNRSALLTITNTATETNIHATLAYSLVNPPSGASISANGIITWTPTQGPATNTIVAVVTNTDAFDLVTPHLAASNSFTVITYAPTIATNANRLVNETQTITIPNSAADNDPSRVLTFSLDTAPANMTINASSGLITWTPSQTQSPSVNTVKVKVSDNSAPALSDTNVFTVTVVEVNNAPTLPALPTQTVNKLALLTVTNTATETNIHATLAYNLINSPFGASISANGIITWTPTLGPATNTIITVVTNTDALDLVTHHLVASNAFTVITYAPTLAAVSNATVNAGQTFSVTNLATDNDPARTLTFSLDAAPSGAAIGSSTGVFTWRPGVGSASSTNAVVVRVTDDSTPALSVTQSFTIAVKPLSSEVTLSAPDRSGNQFTVQASGPAGPDYILQGSASLTAPNWTGLQTNTPVTFPTTLTDTNANVFTNRYYRVKLAP
ncbi:MAG TPA: putative Ig domain-containing protein [Verrucomicrobiae bacterium]|jgi:hypothetical protein|nr:putative Ig domain-containing protein [Verrucomicrobiae bacterium]